MYSEHTNCSYTHMLQSALFQCIRVAAVQEREYDATAVNPALVVHKLAMSAYAICKYGECYLVYVTGLPVSYPSCLHATTASLVPQLLSGQMPLHPKL